MTRLIVPGLLSAAVATAALLPAAAVAGPGIAPMPELETATVQQVGWRDRRRARQTVVDAPTTSVRTDDEYTDVDAPLTSIRSGPRGTWIRAPFVNIWAPRD